LKRLLLNMFSWLAAAAFWLVPGPSSATSIFNLNLLGERLEAGDTRMIALGGGAQLIPDSLGVMQQNPAFMSFFRRVTIGATQYLAVDKGRNVDVAEKNVTVTFPVIMVAFPLTPRVTFGIGYRGKYDPDGSLSKAGVTETGEAYHRIFTKGGGLYSVPFTLGLRLNRYASIGGSFSVENGSIEDRWDNDFEDQFIATVTGIKREELSGTGYTAGVILFPEGPVTVGGTFESPVEYNGDISERYSQPVLDTSYTETVKLPARYSLAAAWRPVESWWILASCAFSDFKKFEGLGFPRDRLYREECYAVGAEYSRGLPLKGQRIPLRFSMNYQRLPYDFPAGQRIRKIMFGIGTGLNLSGGKAKIDMALQAGKVGSLGKNTVDDRLVRFYVGISGSEIWKRKRQGQRD
jgi:long-subunit fatty acid transport protein